MAKQLDRRYTFDQWPGMTQTYMDLDWLIQGKLHTSEDLVLPEGYFINPDETDENSISGPQKDKVLELFDDLNDPPLTVEIVDALRESRPPGVPKLS
jgi:hypothetical protein